MVRERSRLRLIVLIVMTVLGATALYHYGRAYGPWQPRYGELALWSVTLYWLVLWVHPGQRTRTAVRWTVAISVLVECSQLYQAAWLHDLRLTPVGAVLLGSGFHRIDLACHAAGVLLAGVLDTPFQIAEAAPSLRVEH